ncbi:MULTISPECIES: chemotaxis-specific protein-glutamate methyltransferase CheB [unclassified Sulfitobacter]|uniref:chemotaxis-specific protein-glutamate methyltransferase CheB n=1 Tax=unclassified Sulfitobacter TaxID=196795 RepID=UPI0023E2A871|nr:MULTISPECIES: chemotaxis-specific protein-glutamate methyltransferase CheB [unclassified Sulfitobacter]
MQDKRLDFGGGMLHRSNRKRVVIVDDSRSIRRWLRQVLEEDPRLVVVGEASCALTARQVIKDTDPNVVTLDIEMPGMSGLEFLEKLMGLRPMPVVMISGTTKRNSEATITALTLGAIDCILKPATAPDAKARRDICRRVFSAACSKVPAPRACAVAPAPHPRYGPEYQPPLILIGASTGGVAALEQVLAGLHANGPPVVIVQHMPGAFLVSFSQLLNRTQVQDVAIVRAGEALNAGQVRLAPAQGVHTEILRKNGQWSCKFASNKSKARHCPSVDVLFQSARFFSRDIIGVILTGLGRDGAEGLLQLHAGGAHTIGQDRNSSVIYGMPRVAHELGAVALQLPLEKIGGAINHAVTSHAQKQIEKGL